MEQDCVEVYARRFAWRAAHIYGVASPANASPLYAYLSAKVATDPKVIQLVLNADRHTTVENLLFGAVHFLLLSGIPDPLADFYPSLSNSPRDLQDAYPYFRAFCLQHAAEIQQLVTTRTVQTNEVQRCTALLPAFAYLAQRIEEKPLQLIEIGASVGLNLLWDSYGYRYQNAGEVGLPSPIVLACEDRGADLSMLLSCLPTVHSRVGIELAPVDLHNEAATRWVRALIWPEHGDRAQLFRQALTVAQYNQPRIVAGDMVEQLPKMLAEAAAHAALCVYHSYVLNQCPRAVGAAVNALLLAHSRQQPLYRISLEWYSDQSQPHLELFTYCDGTVEKELLAYCESHGRWIEWLPG